MVTVHIIFVYLIDLLFCNKSYPGTVTGTVQGTVREPSGNRAPFENGAQLSIACALALGQKACAQDPRCSARNRAHAQRIHVLIADMLLKGQGVKRFAMGMVPWRIVYTLAQLS